MENIIFYLCLFIAFIAGCLFTIGMIFGRTYGTLTIEDSEKKELWTFIVEKPMEKFEKARLVVFKVKKKNAQIS